MEIRRAEKMYVDAWTCMVKVKLESTLVNSVQKTENNGEEAYWCLPFDPQIDF